jgi:hypothetical protein
LDAPDFARLLAEEAPGVVVLLYLTNEGVPVTVQRLVLDSDPLLTASHYEAELIPALGNSAPQWESLTAAGLP